MDFRCEGGTPEHTRLTLARAPPNRIRLFSAKLDSAVGMSSSPLSNGKQMSDNQSWNSSGSEEDLDTDPGPHGGGVAEFSGVLSKVTSKGQEKKTRVFTTDGPRLKSYTSALNSMSENTPVRV